MSIQPIGPGGSVPCPPRQPSAYLPILGLKGGKKYKFVCLSNVVFGQWLHFNGQRTVAHLNPADRCEWCVAKLPVRWYGFLAVLAEDRRAFLIQLTQGSYQCCPALQRSEGSLRGKRLECMRLKPHNNSPLRCVLIDEVCPVNGYPEPNVPASVRRLFNLADPEQLDQLPAIADQAGANDRPKGGT